MGSTGRDLHFDAPLSNVAINYRPSGMIADLVAPIVNVQKQSDKYVIFDQADSFRIEDDKRAPGTEANIISRSVSSDSYFADNYALKDDLTLEDRENMDAIFLSELRAGRVPYLKDKLMLGWEKRLTDKVTSGTNVGSYSTVTSDWMDTASGKSDPLGDVFTAIYNIEGSTGYRPN